jgi:hypothetical protein
VLDRWAFPVAHRLRPVDGSGHCGSGHGGSGHGGRWARPRRRRRRRGRWGRRCNRGRFGRRRGRRRWRRLGTRGRRRVGRRDRRRGLDSRPRSAHERVSRCEAEDGEAAGNQPAETGSQSERRAVPQFLLPLDEPPVRSEPTIAPKCIDRREGAGPPKAPWRGARCAVTESARAARYVRPPRGVSTSAHEANTIVAMRRVARLFGR